MKYMALTLVLMLLVGFGCKADDGKDGAQGSQGIPGTQGDTGGKGDKGDTGDPGPGKVESITGIIPSDNFTVVDARISPSANITVYIGSFTNDEWTPLTVWNDAEGENVGFIIHTGSIDIVNSSGILGAVSYNIIIVSASPSSKVPLSRFAEPRIGHLPF